MPSSIRDRDTNTPENTPENTIPKDESIPSAQVRYIGAPNGASYGGRALEPNKVFSAPAVDALQMVERWPGHFRLEDEASARAAAEAQRKITTDAELETQRLEAAAKTPASAPVEE